jgi:zinc protease
MRTIRAALASACLLLAFAAAAALPPGVTRGPSVEGITEYRLDNGLKVLLFPDAAKPTITVNITYLVGSRHENHGETGMAHLLEHLLFKGTPRNPDIDKQFNQRGARSNGTTWLDRTNYYELFPAGDDNLRWAIALEADRMVNSFVRKSDLATEMTVVRNEYESGENSPFGVMLKRLQSVAFDWHAYGRSTIGNRSDIENVREENLRAFYRTYYQPDNAVLLVAGRFDEAKAIAWIAESFGPSRNPRARCRPCGPSSPRRTASASSASAARATCSWSRWPTRCPRACTRTRTVFPSRTTCWAIRPPGDCTARSWRPARRRRPSPSRWSGSIRACTSSAPS